MRRSTEIALMNMSKMAGGDGSLEHGKRVIFEIHHTEWLNAQTRIKELELEKEKFAFLTKPLLKNITMPPFLNTPTDLSVGEFATIMSAMESFVRLQGGMSGSSVMGDIADKEI